MDNKHALLIILDGWGYRDEKVHNAIAEANKPYFDYLWANFPHSLLKASGEAVGLASGEMGNSEVGHLTIGAGTPIETDVVRINKAIEDNSISSMPAFVELFKHVKQNNSKLHFMGLVSPGGIHSHIDQLIGLIKVARAAGVKQIVIHAFTDGRDTPPQSGAGFIEKLEEVTESLGDIFISTVSGRYFAMDRDHNWDRVQKAYDAIFEAKGDRYENKKASEVLEELYSKNISDEFIEPFVLLDQNNKPKIIEKNDGVCFFNFRADRARELSTKIAEKQKELNLCFVTMTQYDKSLSATAAFPPIKPAVTLAQIISDNGLNQAHIAETEKYAHVTYFLNGGNEIPHKNEQFVLVNSSKAVATFDQAPEMKAKEITDKAIELLEAGTNFIVMNYANADMVGHSGNEEATIKAIEAIDIQLKRLVGLAISRNVPVFITADHGNAETNVDPKTGIRHTAHTNNPVPAILTIENIQLKDGGLADVAPTILKILNIEKPSEMTGNSLIA